MHPYQKSKPESIQAMFSAIADRYDLANNVLSFRMHKSWNKKLIAGVNKHRPQVLLDLCAGTGDIAYGFLQQAQGSRKVVLLDFCQEMLDCAQVKLRQEQFTHAHDISFVQGDAQQLPFESESVDAISIAYGIRNVKNPELCIQEAYRVLKKGGVLGILELSRPENKIMRMGHSLYLKRVLPLLGKLVTTNKEAYSYLCESINHFIAPDVLNKMLRESGFATASHKKLCGGVAALFVAEK